MGFLKDLNKLNKQAKEIDKTWDPGAQMQAGLASMQAANDMLDQQTAPAQLATTGETATAQVLATRDTGTQLNMQPVLEIDLLVTREGSPPYPVTLRQVVALAQLGRLVPGAALSVRVDPANPQTVLL